MSNQSITQSRRNFLKGIGFTSALSIGGLSSVAFAASGTATLSQPSGSASSDISIMQQRLFDKKTVTLINQTDKLVMVDALKPIRLEQVNGSLVVKVNQIESEALNGMIAISPSEHISFDIKEIGTDFANTDIFPMTNPTGSHLQITSEHSIFNRVIAVRSV